MLTKPIMRKVRSFCSIICCIHCRQIRGDKKGKIPSNTNNNPKAAINIDHTMRYLLDPISLTNDEL